MRSVQNVSSHALWQREEFTEEDTRIIVHRTVMSQSSSKKAPWDLTQFSQLQRVFLLLCKQKPPRSVCATLLLELHALHRPESFLNHPNSFCRGMFKLNKKFDANILLYSFSHFECSGHTVHMFTEQHLRTLTSTVKSSLFTHVHSSPLSLAARLHPCCVNRSRYINIGWTFSGKISYISSILLFT